MTDELNFKGTLESVGVMTSAVYDTHDRHILKTALRLADRLQRGGG